MDELRLGEMESKFADIIWEEAPVASGSLVKICEEKLGWKKSTTYTMLRRLCKRGIFENDSGTVKIKLSRDEFAALKGEQFISENFNGSLPLFLAAFTNQKKLSAREIEELQYMIDKIRGESK